MVWHYWTSTQWSVSIYSCRVRGGFETTQSSKAMKEEWLVGMLLIDHLSWSYWFDGVFNCLACLWDTTLWQLRIVVLVMRQWANAYSIEHFVMHVCVCVCVCACAHVCVRMKPLVHHGYSSGHVIKSNTANEQLRFAKHHFYSTSCRCR